MPYRTKEKQDWKYVAPGYWTAHYCSTGAQTGGKNWYIDPIYVGYSNRIKYETNSKLGKLYTRANNCRHVSEWQTLEPLNIEATSLVGQDVFWRLHDAVWLDRAATLQWLGSIIEPSEEDLRSWNAEAWDSLYPSLEGDVSLSNFLLELSDFTRLFELAASWKSILQRIASLKLPKKGLTYEIARNHIGYSFGIAPMIRDLKELYSALMNYRQRIDDFIKRAGKVQRRHFVKKFDKETDFVVEYSDYGAKTGRGHEKSTEFHATLVYSYEVPQELFSTLGQLNAIRDMVGLRLTPGVVWEAIPFSFVIDWFLPIGRFLESYNEPLLKPVLNVIDYCYSYKVDAIGYSKYSVGKCGVEAPGPNVEWSRCRRKVYVRRKAIPETGTYFTNGNFGFQQLALSASLLILHNK